MNTDELSLSILTLTDSQKAMEYALDSNTPIHFVGPPGIGKSAIVEQAAAKLGYKLETLLLSQCDPTDVGGFPVVDNGKVSRLPLGAIKAACEEPVLLFLDELSCAPPAVQGAALQLIHARRAGDVKLHKGTKVIAASNPADQAAGGWELALPLVSRLTQVRMIPTVKEVQEYFYKLGKEESTLRSLATDFAATLEKSPDLLQINPPKGAQATGAVWGAPRSWERALTFCARALESKEPDNGTIFMAGLAGNVGDIAATAYSTIRKLREKLPGIKEILNNPNTAKLPDKLEVGIAALGVLAQVAIQDACAAWTYAARLEVDELKVAVLTIIGRHPIDKNKSSRWYKDAEKGQAAILKQIGKTIQAK